MNKCNINGHDFYYEQIPYGLTKGGVGVFVVKKVEEAKEFDLYWVIIPTKQNWEKGVSNLEDGHVVCMCKEEIDAKMIAAAINIVQDLSSSAMGLGEFIKTKFKDFDYKYDIDAITEEIRRLRKEGKNDAEILDLIRDKRETFLRKKPAETKKDGGEW